MKIKEFVIKTGQKRVYGSGEFKKTYYLECDVTNTLTGKTITRLSLPSPLKDNLDFFRNRLNWKV